MNLFVAMFTLNLSFLINETVANLGNYTACVVMAAVMHYTMLATFSWFLAQALHLYYNLHKLPSKIKHYMMKICITGWGKRTEPKIICASIPSTLVTLVFLFSHTCCSGDRSACHEEI